MSYKGLLKQSEDEFCIFMAIMAQRALLEEVMLWPKPGLVDPISNGAHKDMDATSFINSATALYESFKDFTKIGIKSVNKGEEELVKALKLRGLKSESEMLDSTGGVNTHKGIIFSFAYLLGATGYIYGVKGSLTVESIINKVRAMSKGLVKGELDNLLGKKTLTNGEKLYLKYKIAGARAEVEQGFPNALTAYDILCKDCSRQARLKALLSIMSTNDDTNVISRGGIKSLHQVKEKSKSLYSLEGEKLVKAMREFDEELIRSNVSPGGSADLLSVALLLVYITNN